MGDIIGVVDLTVRHTSMNPLGIIDAHRASIDFERMVLVACKDLMDNTGDAGRVARMRRRGIVVEGPAAKFFQFECAEDAMAFTTHLRSLLLEKGLPFKLCLAPGTLGERSLRDAWSERLAAAGRSGAEAESAKREVLEQFATTDPDQIEHLFEAYRAPGFHENAISLALDLDAFKGFGVWIDPNLGAQLEGADLFYNHNPVVARRRVDASAREFIDCRFPRDADDVIVRAVDAPAESSPAGQTSRIRRVCELLRRSMKAGEENGVHYVSLLVNIVRSSHYGSIARLASPGSIGDRHDDRTFAAGWQRHPPIFQTLLFDAQLRPILKRVPGIEFALAALVDEIHAALHQADDGGARPASADLPTEPVQPAGSTEHAARRVDRAAAAIDPRFEDAVHAVEDAYGEAIVRRIWSVPDLALSPERKRAALDVTVRR